MLYLVDLIEYCDAMHLPFGYHLASYPTQLCSMAMPSAVRRVASDRLRAYLARRSAYAQTAENLESLAASWEKGEDDERMLREFMIFTNDLDLARGQDFSRTLPELRELILASGAKWSAETRFARAWPSASR
jgi:hypothetical protein